jgi:hypothetical protein
VYGGRQLGKTALLRALERRFRNVQQGRLAVFVDLKRELFSRGRGIDALWSVLVARFQEAGVLTESKVGATAGQEALFRHVKEWLAASPDRRLLLLLDEADTFLGEDGKETDHHEPFPRCQRLKGLMEDTDRRFKVIFAGLHNVQRTTRSANHPLAHFGEAICIGPMLEEAEFRTTLRTGASPRSALPSQRPNCRLSMKSSQTVLPTALDRPNRCTLPVPGAPSPGLHPLLPQDVQDPLADETRPN